MQPVKSCHPILVVRRSRAQVNFQNDADLLWQEEDVRKVNAYVNSLINDCRAALAEEASKH